MTFTEIDYLLLLAIAVMLWRGAVLQRQLDHAQQRADRYANFLIGVGEGKGVIVKDDDAWKFELKEEPCNTNQHTGT